MKYLSKKSEIFKFKYTAGLIGLLFIVLSPCCYSLSKQPSTNQIEHAKCNSEQESVDVVINTACELIYQGQFDQAGVLLNQSGKDDQLLFKELTEIIKEYKALESNRLQSKQQAYKEQLEELEKIKLDDNLIIPLAAGTAMFLIVEFLV